MNKNHSNNILLLSIDNSPIDYNSWLSGFISAEGGFNIRFSEKTLRCEFTIEQRMFYPKTNESFGPCLKKITDMLNVQLKIRRRKRKKKENGEEYTKEYYMVRVENKKSTLILINYLNIHKLKNSKYLDYLNWEKAFYIIIKKSLLDRELILQLKNEMNDKRIMFNWDHLN